ncbi:MAG TPA: amino acid racemase [Planctomycetota bacterium]|nr:amino acid racemase [Planctomycetota bacterium]
MSMAGQGPAQAPARDRRCFGIIGGLGPLAGADLFVKLVRASASAGAAGQPALVFEQRPFGESGIIGEGQADAGARKLYVFDMIRSFESRGVDLVLLPCFISHTFLDEIRPEIRLPVASIMEALSAHVARRHPGAVRLGVLTSDHARHRGLFEKHFGPPRFSLIYPRAEIQRDCLMRAVYGPDGIKSGRLNPAAAALIERACADLEGQGAELILPGFTEIPLVLDALGPRRAPVVDVNQVYAQHALAYEGGAYARAFKVGVVGGVGPAATVDFLDKIVKNTPAGRDQEHIKLLVDHNPQIPDRTLNLVGDGPDPTVALYSACKKLEAGGADAIAIPCNTAHAFVERIQPHLGIPIVNMLHETVEHLRAAHPGIGTAGLLATDGTVASRVYHRAAEAAGISLLVPDAGHQRLVMEAIYGEKGVKAGFREGRCRQDLLAAVEHLARRGARAIILGCTELPLILPASDALDVGDHSVALLDPSDILARKCVSLALAAR